MCGERYRISGTICSHFRPLNYPAPPARNAYVVAAPDHPRAKRNRLDPNVASLIIKKKKKNIAANWDILGWSMSSDQRQRQLVDILRWRLTRKSLLPAYRIRSFQPIRGTPYLDIKMDIHRRATDLYRYRYVSISIYPDSRVDIDISYPNKQVCYISFAFASFKGDAGGRHAYL